MPKTGRPRGSKTGLEKAEIGLFLVEGERIAGAYAIVAHDDGPPRSSIYTPAFKYTLFISITGLRGYYPLLAVEGREPRIFRSFDRILRMLRELGFTGAITVYSDDDPRRPREATGATKRRPGDKRAGKAG